MLREPITEPEISAVQRASGECLSFALLPGKVVAGDKVERHVNEMKRPLRKRGVLWITQFLERQIVGGIKTGERIGVTLRIGSAEIRADETVAVNGVQRKFIHVDKPREAPPD